MLSCCLGNFTLSIKLEEAIALKELYNRLKLKMNIIDRDAQLNKIKKGDVHNLQMESKAVTTMKPKTPQNLRSSSYLLNNILKSPLGSRLQV
uniref:Uncharacterized protein n=1 Tax=Strongyloides papillosus TaxID=174720 RepID=A0A0N5BUE7_STREA